MNNPPPAPRPSVIIWYKVCCVCMAISYFLFSLYIAFLIWFPKDQIAPEGKTAHSFLLLLEHLWGGLLVGTIILTLFFIVALFLPRKPWAWIYGIVALCISIPNCCCLPLSIPVIVLWFRPETKAYFGWERTLTTSPM